MPSGDVNNDGLVDIIQFPIPSEYNITKKFAVTNLNFNSIDMFDNINYRTFIGLQLHMILILTQMDMLVGWWIGLLKVKVL